MRIVMKKRRKNSCNGRDKKRNDGYDWNAVHGGNASERDRVCERDKASSGRHVERMRKQKTRSILTLPGIKIVRLF